MTDLMKPVVANDTVNGSAYINPNSLKIPPSPVQRVDDNKVKDDNILAVSGVLAERFDDTTYYTA